MPMPAKNPAIVLAAYGSAYPGALATYDPIKAAYERAFPGSTVLLAFTSQAMRLELAKIEGRRIPSPLAALAELQDQGQRNVIVQSLHIVPGEEFRQLASLVQGLKGMPGKFGFEHLETGMPLLSSLEDCQKVSLLLPPSWDKITVNGRSQKSPRDPEKEAVALAGHGTGHAADSLYSLLASVLAKDHRNVFLSTLEGFPGIVELILRLKASGTEKVRLLPFLLVVGGHAVEDIAGDGPKSWKSILEREGFDVEAILEGLGENEEMVAIFIEHTKSALERLENRGQAEKRVEAKS
ncbi:Cobalt chelatase (CbiK) [uncultured archaeon]|nr:Cobalt chelatase (CbiK) [uncultured archaeon]